MADSSTYYYRTNSILPQSTETEIEPPRTRIAVACNRCRRRKIKCSGSLEGQSCDACIRASNTECVFADRPPHSRTSPGQFEPCNVSAESLRLQPPAPVRSASLPLNHAIERDIRMINPASRASSENHLAQALPARSAALASNTSSYPMSPPALPKRQSFSTASHPYIRPNSAGVRKSSTTGAVDQVSTNLIRYSQSLIQSQAQQLSGRPQQIRNATAPPKSIPSGYAFAHNTLQQVKQRPIPYQIQTHTMQGPLFRHPSYDNEIIASPTFTESCGTADFGSFPREMDSPDSICYSPMFQPSLYSAHTPELVSSDSVSTLDNRSLDGRSSSSLHLDHGNKAYLSQPFVNLDYADQYQSVPLIDPNQWTPGAEKIANQWLQFSPRPDSGTMNFEQQQHYQQQQQQLS